MDQDGVCEQATHSRKSAELGGRQRIGPFSKVDYPGHVCWSCAIAFLHGRAIGWEWIGIGLSPKFQRVRPMRVRQPYWETLYAQSSGDGIVVRYRRCSCEDVL